MNGEKRKILVPIFNRAHYGRLRPVLDAIKNHPKLELQIIVAVPTAYDSFFTTVRHSSPRSWRTSLPFYLIARLLGATFKSKKVLDAGFLAKSLRNDNFQINDYVPMFLDGGDSITMAKSVGIGIVKLVDILKHLKPDVVFVNADRFEMMAVALTASYMNIPIAHNEGGDVSGTIDESIRHAITKLSHIHFTSTEQSKNRVIQMGENPERIFAVGSPAIDTIKNLDLTINKNIFPKLDVSKPFLLTLLHPIATASAEENSFITSNLISALKDLKIPTVLLGSNMDAGSDEIEKTIRNWIQNENPDYVFFTKHLHPDDFYRYLNASACAVGNSSSFIREGAYFGTPVVLTGSRQNKRERSENILESDESCENIKSAIARQLKTGHFQKSLLFGSCKASGQIAEILSEVNLEVQKSFCDL